jgi:hypothetical protein
LAGLGKKGWKIDKSIFVKKILKLLLKRIKLEKIVLCEKDLMMALKFPDQIYIKSLLSR